MLLNDMVSFAIILDTGEVVKAGRCNVEFLAAQGEDEEFGYIKAFDSFEVPDPRYFYWSWKGEGFVPYPSLRPTPFHKWSGVHWVGWIDTRTDEEAAADAFRELRLERDRLLAASDWTDTVSARNRLSQDVQDAWDAYRMALRDLPDNTEDPTNVVWPTPPGK